MKKIILGVLVLLVLVGVGIFFLNKTQKVTNVWKVYSNEKYNFEFKYPSQLKISVFNGDKIPDQLYDVVFLSVKEGSKLMDEHFFIASYSPSVEDTFNNFPVPPEVKRTLGDYVNYYIGHMSEFPNFPKGAVWSEEMINGIKYYKMTAPGVQSYFVDHSGIFVITFLTGAPEHAGFVKYIPEMISSFKFTK